MILDILETYAISYSALPAVLEMQCSRWCGEALDHSELRGWPLRGTICPHNAGVTLSVLPRRDEDGGATRKLSAVTCFFRKQQLCIKVTVSATSLW
jgi:hypothetical protein